MSILEILKIKSQFKFDSIKKEVYVYNFLEKQYDSLGGYGTVGITDEMLIQDKCLTAIAFLDWLIIYNESKRYI